MRILGIDPGIGRTGWGIVDFENGKLKAIAFDCIETSPSLDSPKRLLQIFDEVTGLISSYKPHVIVVEELFFNTNAKTAFSVGEARGTIVLAGVKSGLQVEMYTPLQVKNAVAGYGRADKAQVGRMVKTLLNLESIPKPDDTADALAVALAYAFASRFQTQIHRAKR